MFENLRADLGRYPKRALLLNPSTWAIVSYRFRRAVHRSRFPLLKWPAYGLGVFTDIVARLASHVEFPTRCEIGRGLLLPHAGHVIVAADAKIGHHCTIGPGVTIGHARGGKKKRGGSPEIGDRVYIGPGSIIIGPIHIANDALIGAGSVVVASVPPRGVVAGNPARLLSRRGSFEMISYAGMETDPGRIASLEEGQALDASRLIVGAEASKAQVAEAHVI
ncbi:MAG TPA: hypothetical protein VFP60_03555 [Pseudolabrys sp.]|nr:hypothetical protein [Pseudolabrys sp.]